MMRDFVGAGLALGFFVTAAAWAGPAARPLRDVVAEAGKGYPAPALAVLAGAGVWDKVEAELKPEATRSGARPWEAVRLAAYRLAVEGSDDPRVMQAVQALDGAGFFSLALATRLGDMGEDAEPLIPRAAAAKARLAPDTHWREVVRPEEPEQFKAMAAEINEVQDKLMKTGKTDGVLRRGFHAKGQGGMNGTLRVLSGLPPELAQGLFAKSAEYACLVRFSNGVGAVANDWAPDVRGLAVKVLGVAGEALPEAEPGIQDFLCTNQPASFARDAVQFMAFARGNTNPLKLPFVLARDLGAREAARMLKRLGALAFQVPRSLATTTYWTGARSFGPFATRILFKPQGAVPPPRRRKNGHFLKDELVERLRAGPVRFDVLAQLYVDEGLTPIEDGSVPWDEAASPPRKVAELELPATDLASAEGVATEAMIEGLAFNPWNGLAAHRPLGHLQRARALVYRSSAAHRGATGAAPAR